MAHFWPEKLHFLHPKDIFKGRVYVAKMFTPQRGVLNVEKWPIPDIELLRKIQSQFAEKQTAERINNINIKDNNKGSTILTLKKIIKDQQH